MKESVSMGRKWNNIKEKKAMKDKNTSRIYAKFGREIYVAAKKGEPDPESNVALKTVLDKAKTFSIPKHIIDKAIEKAKGSDEENFTELTYEGFGPGGAMLIVDALTNNVNRTASDVRAAFGKNFGTMGNSGAVCYMFEARSMFAFTDGDAEETLLYLMEQDIDVIDVAAEDDFIIVYGDASQFSIIKQALDQFDIKDYEVAELIMYPQSEVTLGDEEMEQFEQLIQALEDLEDVSVVHHNVGN